ncbi:DUF1016 N-terminal domain-containing protein [Pararhodonellum marinum]|uniref:DUF1016 N-terminal domain-containing protein n=1 Tax=Pararhodonellum marinum TaxID=2755358 RepID=UPI00188EF7FE|nr:DUF1016 N-terminal domain-containing protein [Pararhodonellum marinum]
MEDVEKNAPKLFCDVCQIIEGKRSLLSTTAHAEVCLMHWNIGKRIKEEVLYNKRAEYGKEVVKKLSVKLADRYGKGWSDRKLSHCIRTAYAFTLGDSVRSEYPIGMNAPEIHNVD